MKTHRAIVMSAVLVGLGSCVSVRGAFAPVVWLRSLAVSIGGGIVNLPARIPAIKDYIPASEAGQAFTIAAGLRPAIGSGGGLFSTGVLYTVKYMLPAVWTEKKDVLKEGFEQLFKICSALGMASMGLDGAVSLQRFLNARDRKSKTEKVLKQLEECKALLEKGIERDNAIKKQGEDIKKHENTIQMLLKKETELRNDMIEHGAAINHLFAQLKAARAAKSVSSGSGVNLQSGAPAVAGAQAASALKMVPQERKSEVSE